MIPNFTFSSKNAPRLVTGTGNAMTGKIDYFSVRKGAGVLLSLFGYNAGAQQWLQLFDTDAGAPTITLSKGDQSSWDAGIMSLGGSQRLADGEPVIITGVGAITDAAILFAHQSTYGAGNVSVHDTLADALTGDDPLIPQTDDEDGGVLTFLPLHTFAIGAADNFSVIVPHTGINFSRGLVAAVSTTGPLYTAGAKDVTLCGTLIA